MNLAPLLLCLSLVPVPEAAAPLPERAVLLDLRRRTPVALDELADALAERDVVFLGEDHDHDLGHAAQSAILQAVAARRPDVILSLEMFERDVQAVLDDYLAGRIDEATFRKRSRPWPNYAEHYRPLVEFAKARGLEVLAANVPRRAASAVAKGESPDRADAAWLPRGTTAPRDAYWDRFRAVMAEHAGAGSSDDGSEDAATGRYYAAQCLKDDAMAEAVADALAARPHRTPLVVHVAGRFHGDEGLGTVARLLSRKPLLNVAVVTTAVCDAPARPDWDEIAGRGHYALAVPPQPLEAPRP